MPQFPKAAEDIVANAIQRSDLDRLGDAGFATTEVIGHDGPTSPPSVYLHQFCQDGVLRWLWSEPWLVPPGVRPVTEPADYIAECRRTCGWAVDQPVYGCEGGMLRLWTENGLWFVDNAVLYAMSNLPATFVWSFVSLDEAIAGALRYFAARRYLESRGVSEAWR
jgi:hypothetical protein